MYQLTLTDKQKEKLKFVSLILSIIIFITPIGIFVFNFWKQDISHDITRWGAFGDFFGGILNTIISLISLIVLGYLTYLIGKQSNEENKKTNILLRKLDAFNELTSFLPNLRYFAFELIRLKENLNYFSNEKTKDIIKYENSKLELCTKIEYFFNFFNFLISYETRFYHLFEYNFAQKDYINLIDNGNKLNDYFILLRKRIELNISDEVLYDDKTVDTFFNLFDIFIVNLRKELI